MSSPPGAAGLGSVVAGVAEPDLLPVAGGRATTVRTAGSTGGPAPGSDTVIECSALTRRRRRDGNTCSSLASARSEVSSIPGDGARGTGAQADHDRHNLVVEQQRGEHRARAEPVTAGRARCGMYRVAQPAQFVHFTTRPRAHPEPPIDSVPGQSRERELHAADVSSPPARSRPGARELLALARGHQLAKARKQLGLAQRGIASAMGVSVARVSQIEHGEVTSFEVVARYVEALGGRLDLVADFGDPRRAPPRHAPGPGTPDACEARKNLFPLIEQVNDDRTPIEITSRRGDAVLLARADYEALEETAHLLRVPANARRLIESLQQPRTGQREEHDLAQ